MSDDVTYAREIDAIPEKVFDAFTQPDGQRAFYEWDQPGWIVKSECELRVGGIWAIDFGPSRDEVYRHEHVFRVIERPHRVLVETTETRGDGSIIEFEMEWLFERRDSKTLMTMIQRGLPPELREEHSIGVPNAFDQFQRALKE